MELFDEIVESTKAEYESSVLNCPLFKIIRDGHFTRRHYVAYLKETYHLVRETSRGLALVAANLTHKDQELRRWFFEQSLAELGHDQFCITDLENIGEKPEEILDGTMMEGAWGMVCQIYYMAHFGNPKAILGVATATEGMGANLASGIADLLVSKYGIPKTATTFLKSHGYSDMGHIEDARRAINTFISDPKDIRDLKFARKMTLRFYGQLFDDVVSVEPIPGYRREPALAG